MSSFNVSLPLSNRVQRLVSSAYKLPFTSNSTFTLSLGSFYGKYFVYAGNDTSHLARVTASHMSYVLTSSKDSQSWQTLSNLVTPGEFIRVGGQEFRVCMNQDPQFYIDYAALNASVIPLCSVADAFVPMMFEAGYTGNFLKDIPVYTLDTVVGGAPDPELGSSIIYIVNADRSTNINVGLLVEGDWVMIGHPTEGEMFRVYSNANSILTLAASVDLTTIASLTSKGLQHATYEVQEVSFTASSLTTVTEEVGFRLRFRDASTFVTQAGGAFGCLNLLSTASEVRAELMSLYSVDDITVSRPANTSTAVSFRVTFVGEMLRGAVPLLEVVDLGSNGCNTNSGSAVASVSKVRSSVVPVYRMETTAALAYDATSAQVKDALETLNLIARVEVARTVELNGLAWTITFRGFESDSSSMIAALYVNSVNIEAAIDGKIAVSAINRYEVGNLTNGVPYYFSVAAVNGYGAGVSTNSQPASKQPSDQLPMAVQQLRTFISINSNLEVQFNKPISTGGKPITYYRVQIDSAPTFNSGLFRKPLEEVIVYSNMISRRPDVQVLSVVSDMGYTPEGTFVLQFLGQWTPELDYNISASGMTSALEGLSTINKVSVVRELFCSAETGRNNCGDERGYVWRISFLDVIDNGLQVEEYVNTFESNFGSRLAVTGSYLQGCERTRPSMCYSNSTTVAFLDSHPEVQEMCLCNDNTASMSPVTGSVFGSSVSLNSSLTVSEIASLIEVAQGVGHVTVSGPTAVYSGCGCSGRASKYAVTFDSFLGDVPMMKLSSGTVTEMIKGRSQFVEGVADYSVQLTYTLALFASYNSTYVRVAAVNSVGQSDYVSPAESPIVKYNGAPDRPVNVAAVSSSKSSMKVYWQQQYNSSDSYVYAIEYDTSSNFVSYCSEAVCSTLTSFPLGQVSTSNLTTVQYLNMIYYQYEITGLVSGEAYFVRVKSCYNSTSAINDRLCSPYGYKGYPLDPISTVPSAVPLSIKSGRVSSLNSSAIAVDWYSPQVLSEGSNGQPVSAYTIALASPVREVQQIKFTDTTSVFASTIMINYGSSMTRCIPMVTSALELEVKLGELSGLSALSVSYETETSSATERVFTVTFPASLGDVSALSYGGSCAGGNLTAVVQVRTLIEGQRGYVPEIYKIVTQNSTSETLSAGGFEIRYGFRGNMEKVAPTSDYTAVVTASITAGARTVVVSSSLSHLIAPGAVIRVGDQEVTVEGVSTSGLIATFSPYHVQGTDLSSLEVYVSETLLATATVTSTKTFATTTDLTSEVFPGDYVLITRSNEGSGVVVSSATALVSLVTSALLTVVDSINLSGTATKVLVYRQKNKFIPYDAGADELKVALQSLSAVGKWMNSNPNPNANLNPNLTLILTITLTGTVDVTRYGPSTAEGYTWSVSFTSVYGNTETCSGSCLKVYRTSSSAITISSSRTADTDGDYVSDSFIEGRRVYNKIDSPYYIAYNAATSMWEIRIVGISAVIQDAQFTSTSITPVFGSYATVTMYTSSPTPSLMYGSVEGSIVQTGLAPSLLNLAPVQTETVYNSEVQVVTVTTLDGIADGGFSLDFNSSAIPLYFRADESATDMETKLESLSTVGKVNVTRSVITGTDGIFIGYNWEVLFVSNEGDLPLMTYTATPTYGLALEGSNATISVVELVKGSALPSVSYLSGLMAGEEYTVQVFASNSNGLGESSIAGQNDGMGMMPLSFTLVGEPSAPALLSVVPRSSSQLELMISPPVLSGGSDASSYLLEYTTNTSFGQTEELSFRMYNTASNDSTGYFTVSFFDTVTALLPWGVSGDELATAINDLAFSEGVSATRTVLSASTYGQGYLYTVVLIEELIPVGNFSLDISRLSSQAAVNNFRVDLLSRSIVVAPSSYKVQRMYKDCGVLAIGAKSAHQVVSIETTRVDNYGSGSFRLTLGSPSSSYYAETDCLPYSVTTDALQIALEALEGVDNVFVEEYKRNLGVFANSFRDLHVFFEGFAKDVEWPMFRANDSDNGNYWSGLGSSSCSRDPAYGSYPVKATVLTVDDRVACIGGSPEIQTVIIEGKTGQSLGGYFYLYLNGEKSLPVSATASAEDMASAVNTFSAVDRVSVTRYTHYDTPFAGYAWVITFPSEYGDVEQLGINDKYVTGLNIAVNVYPMVNISMTADQDDISGHFQIAIGSQSTVSLSFDATDSTVLTALQNLTSVGKVAMLGLRGQETYQSLPYTIYVTSTLIGTNSFYINSNTSTIIEVGDAVSLGTGGNYTSGVATSYISSIVYSSGVSTYTVNDQIIATSLSFFASIGTNRAAKVQFPGKVSIVPLAQVVTLTTNSQAVTVSESVPTGDLYINGTLVTVSSISYCTDGTTNYCLELSANYTGSGVVDSDTFVFLFPVNVTLLFSIPPGSLVALGDMIWIGEEQLIVNSISGSSVTVRGADVFMGYEGASAFYYGYGYERALVFKATTADVHSVRVNIGADWRGTNVQIRTKRTDGILPGMLALGGASELQTVIFRAPSAAVSSALSLGGLTYQLVLGSELVGNFTYGASASEWQTKLQTLLDVDSLTVSRQGDGASAIYSYGYSYTIAFYGAYGLEGIPQLTSDMRNMSAAGVDVRHDTVREVTKTSPLTLILTSP
jgi:hypothetical protein